VTAVGRLTEMQCMSNELRARMDEQKRQGDPDSDVIVQPVGQQQRASKKKHAPASLEDRYEHYWHSFADHSLDRVKSLIIPSSLT